MWPVLIEKGINSQIIASSQRNDGTARKNEPEAIRLRTKKLNLHSDYVKVVLYLSNGRKGRM